MPRSILGLTVSTVKVFGSIQILPSALKKALLLVTSVIWMRLQELVLTTASILVLTLTITLMALAHVLNALTAADTVRVPVPRQTVTFVIRQRALSIGIGIRLIRLMLLPLSMQTDSLAVALKAIPLFWEALFAGDVTLDARLARIHLMINVTSVPLGLTR